MLLMASGRPFRARTGPRRPHKVPGHSRNRLHRPRGRPAHPRRWPCRPRDVPGHSRKRPDRRESGPTVAKAARPSRSWPCHPRFGPAHREVGPVVRDVANGQNSTILGFREAEIGSFWRARRRFYDFKWIRLKVPRILRTSRASLRLSLVAHRKVCSQIRNTRQPVRRKARFTSRSRARLRANFFFQNDRLPLGCVPCRGQPCQKQPSTKIAVRDLRKTKSGRTASDE